MEEEAKEKEKQEGSEKELYAMYDGTVIDTDETIPYGVATFEEYDNAVAAKKAATSAKKEAEVYKALIDRTIEDDRVVDFESALLGLAKSFANRITGFWKKKEKEVVHSGFQSPFTVFKDKDGTPRWITRYSNNFRDQDNPPEIISAKSHEYFEEMVDKGVVPMPELWIWHMPIKIGDAEVVTFDKENGIAIAAGSFDEKARDFADLIASNPEEWGVSHGMPGQYIVRSKEDPTVIEKHITTEISILPKYAAANKWADFQVLKEVDMTIKQEKLEQLAALNATPEMLEQLQEGNKELSEGVDVLGIERKEIDEEPVAEEVEVEPEVKEEDVTESVQEPETKEEEQQEADPEEAGLREEVKEALSLMTDVVKELQEKVVSLEEKLTEKEADPEPEIPEDMPAMSLKEFLIQGLNVKEGSATVSSDTIVDGRTKLAQDKPAETKEETPAIVNTGLSFLDAMITDIAVGEEQPA